MLGLIRIRFLQHDGYHLYKFSYLLALSLDAWQLLYICKTCELPLKFSIPTWSCDSDIGTISFFT